MGDSPVDPTGAISDQVLRVRLLAQYQAGFFLLFLFVADPPFAGRRGTAHFGWPVRAVVGKSKTLLLVASRRLMWVCVWGFF